MFGKKKKKQAKDESLLNEENQATENGSESDNASDDQGKLSKVDEFVLGIDNGAEDDEGFHLTEAQRNKVEKLDSVKDKIARILQSQNIEIVDENFGDEYESEFSSDSDEKKQQDYDSLKALFGEKSKAKAEELTLTIDDFDYTYVGQYVDEFDLMHMKNIKKVKLKKKYPKHLKKVLIAASVAIIIGLGTFFGFYLTRDIPVVLESISLSQTEHTYYMNSNFQFDELYIHAKYSNGKVKSIPLTRAHIDRIVGIYNLNGDEITFTGGKHATLTISYSGKTTDYTVILKEKVVSGLFVTDAPALYELDAGEVVTEDYLRIYLDYGEAGKQKLEFSQVSFYVDNVKMNYEANKSNPKQSGYKLTAAITSASTIKIVYPNNGNVIASLEFSK